LFVVDRAPPRVTLTVTPDPPVGETVISVSCSEPPSAPPEVTVADAVGNWVSIPLWQSTSLTNFLYRTNLTTTTAIQASATDRSGNRGAASKQYLDLWIGSGDIVIAGQPGQGSNVTVSATVHAASAFPVTNVVVRFQAGDVGSELPLGADRVTSLPANGGATISAVWPAGQQSAEYLLSVVVDPENSFLETSETNNTARMGSYRVWFSRDRGVYLRGRDTNVWLTARATDATTLVPLGDGTVAMSASVFDANGQSISGPSSMAYDTNLQAFRLSLPLSFFAQDGAYTSVVTCARSGFANVVKQVGLTVASDFTVSIQPDQATYDRGEVVRFSGVVQSQGSTPCADFPVELRILRGSSLQLLSARTGTNGQYAAQWAPDSLEAGNYLVQAVARAGDVSRTASNSFVVLGLYLNPAAVRAEVPLGGQHRAEFKLKNLGQTTLNGLQVRLTDRNPADSVAAVLDAAGLGVTLPCGAETGFAIIFSSATQMVQNAAFDISVTTTEGSTETGVCFVDTVPVSPYLVIDPWYKEVAVNPGTNSARSFTIRVTNTGYDDVENVVVNASQLVPWIKLEHALALGTIKASEGWVDCGFGYLRKHALIGRMGTNGTPFEIGGQLEFIAETDGELFLRINEADPDLADNGGRLAVEIRAPTNLVTVDVLAANGWQATGVQLESGAIVRCTASGLWRTEPGVARNALGQGCVELPVTVHSPDASWLSPNPYDMMLFFESSNATPVAMGIRAWVRNDATGQVRFHVSDNLGDLLQGAHVVLYSQRYDPASQSYQTYSLATDSRGEAPFTNVLVGNYRYYVNKSSHAGQSGILTIEPGRTNDQFVTLVARAIDVSWSVVPTTIEDRYNIVVEMKYDTRQGPPILIVGPPISHSMRPTNTVTGTISIANLGRTPVHHLRMEIGGVRGHSWSCDGFRFELLTPLEQIPELLDGLVPGESVSVGYRVTETANEWDHSYDGVAHVSGVYTNSLGTGEVYDDLPLHFEVPIGLVINPPELWILETDATGTNKWALEQLFGGGNHGAPEPATLVHYLNIPVPPPFLLPFWPTFTLPVAIDYMRTPYSFTVENIRYEAIGELTCPWGLSFDSRINIFSYLEQIAGIALGGPASWLGETSFLEWAAEEAFGQVLDLLAGQIDRMKTMNIYIGEFGGWQVPLQIQSDETVDLTIYRYVPPWYGFEPGDIAGTISGQVTFDGRWLSEVSANTFTIPVRGILIKWFDLSGYVSYSKSGPGNGPGFPGFTGFPDVPAPTSATEPPTDIYHTIRLSHDLVLERDAFDAELRIANALADHRLENVHVTVQVTDASGNVVMGSQSETNGPFYFMAPELIGLSGVGGTGALEAATVGSAKWVIIPKPSAGGTEPAGKEYYVGARLEYTVNGQVFDYYTERVRIVVKPQPLLDLEYFIPSYVQANTPFKLAVRVTNAGYGTARNTHIENNRLEVIKATAPDAGQLNYFELVGLEVGGVELPPSGVMQLGDISPGDRRVGYWIMQADPGGTFVSIDATYTHSDELGGQATSLIRNVRTGIIMCDTVIKNLPGEDAHPDILVDRDADGSPDNLFDPVSGTLAGVNRAWPAVFGLPTTENPSLSVSISPAPGWNYFEVISPLGTGMGPRWINADGLRQLDVRNYWMTDNRICVLDYGGTNYTIAFQPASVPPSITSQPQNRTNVLGTTATFAVVGNGTAPLSYQWRKNGVSLNESARITGVATATLTIANATHADEGVYSVLVGNAAGSALSSNAALVVLAPPDLAPVSNRFVRVNQSLIITNVAADPDLPAQRLAFSLDPGAPAGASIDPDTGVFRWTPLCAQGSTTNTITVRVTDNGAIPLSATQTFTVVVYECVEASLGGTVVEAGRSSCVPVHLLSTVALTNLAFAIGYPPERLTNLTVTVNTQAISAPFVSLAGPGQLLVSFELSADRVLHGPTNVGALCFNTLAGQSSAFVPLVITDVDGIKPSGQVVANAYGQPGRAVVVGREPLLEAVHGTNGRPSLLLYGQPGWMCAVEEKASLLPGTQWSEVMRLPLVNLVTSLPVPGTNVQSFYRAVRVLSAPRLSLESVNGSVYRLKFLGQPADHYAIETTTTLPVTDAWLPVVDLPLTNSLGFFDSTNLREARRLFRARLQ